MENCNAKATLAFDCSTPNASVALMVGDNLHHAAIGKGQHAAQLVPEIDRLLKAANIDYAALSRIVTPTGPGSFTGLRIALATAHGLHLAVGTPLSCPSTLDAIAFHFFASTPNATQMRAIMGVGKGEVAHQLFDAKPSALPVAAGPITRANATDEALFAGDAPCMGTHEHPSITAISGIDARWLCAMAAHLPITPIAEATPFYIRPPDAIIPEAPHWLAS